MSLKCWISSPAMKCWGKIVQTLISAGENEIHISGTQTGLTLYTYDTSHTICCTCTLDKHFFFRYELPGNDLRCRIHAKCILKPFKSLRFLQRCIDVCEFEFNVETNSLIITIPCKGGVNVRHTVPFSVETDPNEIDFDPSVLKNSIEAEPKVLTRSLSNFSGGKSVSELTLKVTGNKLLLKNCANDMMKREAKVYTELMMNSIDFIHYGVESDTELSFPLREFKSVVSFADHLKSTLSLAFHDSTMPLQIKAQNMDGQYCITLLLATRAAVTGNRTTRKKANPFHTSLRNGRINDSSSTHSAVASFRGQQSTPESSRLQKALTPFITPKSAVNTTNLETPVNPTFSKRTPTLSSSTRTNRAASPRNSSLSVVNNSKNQTPVSSNKSIRQQNNYSVSLLQDQDIMDVDVDLVQDLVNDNQNFAPASPSLLIPEENINCAPVSQPALIRDNVNKTDNFRKGNKRMKLLFPTLGQTFDPHRDLPGYNEVLCECSDEEV